MCILQVADCVSLFCLDKPGAIPVDTHVWQIAARDYMPKLKQAKSLTDKLYEEIGKTTEHQLILYLTSFINIMTSHTCFIAICLEIFQKIKIELLNGKCMKSHLNLSSWFWNFTKNWLLWSKFQLDWTTDVEFPHRPQL